MYCESYRLMTENVKDYVPPSWVSMAEVKSHYFSALAHFYAVTAVLDQPGAFSLPLDLQLCHSPSNPTGTDVKQKPSKQPRTRDRQLEWNRSVFEVWNLQVVVNQRGKGVTLCCQFYCSERLFSVSRQRRRGVDAETVSQHSPVHERSRCWGHRVSDHQTSEE